MKIVFIADAHLKGLDDPNQKTLVDFLDSLRNVTTLVILGDLFDFWTGYNRVVEKNYRPALDALLRLKKRGVEMIYLEGNHDFSMGAFFTGDLKAKVCPGSHILELKGKRFYLSHGDTVKMTFGYRLWRAYLRSALFRFMARVAGPQIVWDIALGLSNKSRARSTLKRYNSTEEALRSFALKKIDEGFDGVVMAHSHSSGVHREKGGVYANPGSFNDGCYLVWENGEFRAEQGLKTRPCFLKGDL